MTVSRALGGRGRIAEETRAEIRAIAERLGYRPDPEVAKLMHHLRVGKRRRPEVDYVAQDAAMRAADKARAERTAKAASESAQGLGV